LPINSARCVDHVIPTKWRSYREHRLCDVISPYVYGTRNGVRALAHAHTHTASELLCQVAHSCDPFTSPSTCRDHYQLLNLSVCLCACVSVCVSVSPAVRQSISARTAGQSYWEKHLRCRVDRSLVHTCIRQPTGNEVASHFY